MKVDPPKDPGSTLLAQWHRQTLGHNVMHDLNKSDEDTTRDVNPDTAHDF
jgi:hypothetical protein